MVIKITESVGLKGAQTIGDKKVSSLLQFSWGTRNDRTGETSQNGHSSGKRGTNGQSAVSKPGSGKTD
jgi:hypothetical protein